MTEPTSSLTIQKNSKIWSSRLACQILVRIEYQIYEDNGCTIYEIKQVEELEKQAA